jgi:hypothetical protein
MKLGPEECDLVGSWIFDGTWASADPIENRIRYLIEHHLEKVAVSPDSGGWDTLYRDPSDGRYWERTYPQGRTHGGGPMRLTNISNATAIAKYRLQLS